MNTGNMHRNRATVWLTCLLIALFVAAALLFHLASTAARARHAQSKNRLIEAPNFLSLARNLPDGTIHQGVLDPRQKILASYGNLPLAFEPNQGQARGGTQFLARGRAYSILLTPQQATLSFRKLPVRAEQRLGGNHSRTKQSAMVSAQAASVVIKLLGSKPVGSAVPLEELPGKSNYFIGNDPHDWITNVPHYSRIQYKDVYPGIDLIYYGNQQQLEGDFIVAPGANPKSIKFGAEGTQRLERSRFGDLILHTANGEVRLHKPVTYQRINNAQIEVASRFRLTGKNKFNLEISGYDSTRTLVIDPVLTYSTFLGGTNEGNGIGFDQGNAIAVDSSGDSYVIGQTTSLDFPTVQGDFQPASPGGVGCVALGYEAFVTKLNSSGSALVYSTYLGGPGCAIGRGIAVDSAGNAYVAGSAGPGFPTTSQAFQKNYGGPGNTNLGDAFVAKLNPTGTALLYSTYVGGGSGDIANGLAVDRLGNAYVIGQTFSTDFPTVPAGGVCSDGSSSADFATEVNSDGSQLVYSTCLGKPDIGFGIAVDSTGNAYVTGAGSAGGTTSPIGSCIGVAGGYFAKLNPDGTAAFVDCFPGVGLAVAVDSTGNTYLTGYTTSPNFPTTPGAFQGTCSSTCAINGFSDAFLMKLNPAGTAALYATYLGGTGNDIGAAIAIDSSGNAYVSGNTTSVDFPLASPIQPSFGGGTSTGDAFLAEVNANGSALLFSTFLGGSLDEVGTGVALDSAGGIYLTGSTASGNFPVTPAGFQTSFKGPAGVPGDAFVAKFAPPVTFSANSLDFGAALVGTTSTPQSVTLRNNDGRASLTIDSITTSGDFKQTNDCGGSVAVAATCTISLTFAPVASGTRTGALVISDGAAGSPQTVALTGVGTDFSIEAASGGPTSVAVTAGQTATYNLQVKPVSGFNATVVLSCTGVPSLATCTVAPTSVTPNGSSPSAFTVTVTTIAPSMVTPRTMPPSWPPANRLRFGVPLLMALILFALQARFSTAAARRKLGFAHVLVLVSLLSIAACVSGCSGGGGGGVHNPGTPAGTYTITITGTSSGVSRTQNLTLTVN